MDNYWITGAVQAIKALSYVYDLFTFPVYLILQRPWQKRKATRRIKAKPIVKDEHMIMYRNVDPIGAMHVTMVQQKIDTLEAMLKWVAGVHGNKRCLGTRQILAEEDEVQPNGRVFKKVGIDCDFFPRFFTVFQRGNIFITYTLNNETSNI